MSTTKNLYGQHKSLFPIGHMSPRSNRYFAAQAMARKALMKKRMEAKGKVFLTLDSRPCACGKPALRVWENKGWCRKCYEESAHAKGWTR